MKTILTLFTIFFSALSVMAEPIDLDGCVRMALANNPDLLQSEYTLQQSQIGTKQAWSELYPGVSASTSTSNTGPITSEMQNDWNWSMGGTVSQQFYRPGLYTGIRLAETRETLSKYSLDNQRDLIKRSVINLYYKILTSDTLAGVYKANIRISDEQILKMRTMVDLGLKRESDLLKSEVQRGTFEAQLVRELESLASSKRGLNILMGRSPNTPLEITPLPVDRIDLPDEDTALAVMHDNNPTLKRFKAQVDVEKLSLRVAREAYLPSVTGSYSYNRQNNSLGGPPIEGDQVSLRLSLDIFDGFNKRQNVQLSKLGMDQALLDYEASVRDMEEALANQYSALKTQNRLISIHETNLASARKDLQVVMEQYTAGFSTILDLNDSQVSVLESETSLLQDLYSRKQIEAEIHRLMGK